MTAGTSSLAVKIRTRTTTKYLASLYHCEDTHFLPIVRGRLPEREAYPFLKLLFIVKPDGNRVKNATTLKNGLTCLKTGR